MHLKGRCIPQYNAHVLYTFLHSLQGQQPCRLLPVLGRRKRELRCWTVCISGIHSTLKHGMQHRADWLLICNWARACLQSDKQAPDSVIHASF